MDKEEAMKILKDFHDKSALFSVRTALETLHPELAESDDEKTRKRIIALVNAHGQGIYKGDMLTWLENIPYTIDHEKREGFHLGYKAGLEKQGESSDQIHYWTEEEIEPIISDYLRGAEHYGGMMGRLRCLKPKPLEKQGTSYTKSDVDDAYLKGISDAKNELEKQGQKPAWSEKDEKEYKYVLKFVDNILNNCGNKKDYEHCKRCYDWLKSFRQRIGG